MRYALGLAAVAAAALFSAACGKTADAVSPVSPTDPPSAAASAVVKTLQVAPTRVECTGVGPQTCLQVRESSDAAWTLLHDPIAGFDYEPGYLYEIRVREQAVENPPADGSSVQRTLVSVLGKTPVPLSVVGPTWRLVSLDGRAVLGDVRVTAVFAADDRVAGSGGCNRYFGRAAVSDAGMDVGLLATTMMYCGAEGVMPQEQAYVAALEKARALRVAGAELRLGPAPGIVTLVFKAE